MFSDSDVDDSNVGSESENDFSSNDHDKEENNNEGVFDDGSSDDNNEETSCDNGEDNELEDDYTKPVQQGTKGLKKLAPPLRHRKVALPSSEDLEDNEFLENEDEYDDYDVPKDDVDSGEKIDKGDTEVV